MSKISYSPKHHLNNAVSYFSKDSRNQDQETTLTLLTENSDEEEEDVSVEVGNDHQLQFHDDACNDIPTGTQNKRKTRRGLCFHKIYISLIAVITLVLFIIIWFSVKGRFHKSETITNDNIKLIFEHSSMKATISNEDKEFISINLGKNSVHDLRYEDSKDCASNKNEICQSWDIARLQIKPVSYNLGDMPTPTQCFSFLWESSNDASPQDCVNIAYEMTDHVWFDTHQYKMWPKESATYYEYYTQNFDSNMTTKNECENSSLAYVPGAIDSKTAIPLDKMGGTIVEPMWLNSKGILIKMAMHDQINAHSQICSHGDSKLCLGTHSISHAHQDLHSKHAVLNVSSLEYQICINDNVSELHNVFLKGMVKSTSSKSTFNTNISYESGPTVAIKEQTLSESCADIMNKPLWNIIIRDKNYDVSTARSEISDIEDIGGVALLNLLSEMSTKIGDYDVVNDTRNVMNYITMLQMSNFSVMLPVTPFIHYSSKHLKTGLLNDYFVKNADGSNILINVEEDNINQHVGIIDLTNPEASTWFENNLNNFLTGTKSEYLYFSHGQAAWLPSNHKLYHPLHNEAHFSTLYAEVASKMPSCAVTNVAFSTQRLNQIVMLSPVGDMRLTLKEALSAGLAGYPFFIPNLPSPLEEAAKHLSAGLLEDGYIRWVQMITFFPVMHIPWDYQTLHDQKIDLVELSKSLKKFANLRNKKQVKSAFKKAVLEATSYGKPIMRPMWMFPSLPNANYSKLMAKVYDITDQFMIGDNLIVAPVLELGQTKRDIYFPPGKWIDIINGSEVHVKGRSNDGLYELNYPSSINHIPVFYKLDLRK